MALVIQSHYRPGMTNFAGQMIVPPTLTRVHVSGTLEAPVEVICEAFGVGLDRIAFDVRTLLPHFDPVVHLEP